MHVNKVTFCNENYQPKRLIGEKKANTAAWQTYDDDWCFHKHPSPRSIGGHIVLSMYIRVCIRTCTNGIRVQESVDEASLHPDIGCLHHGS